MKLLIILKNGALFLTIAIISIALSKIYKAECNDAVGQITLDYVLPYIVSFYISIKTLLEIFKIEKK